MFNYFDINHQSIQLSKQIYLQIVYKEYHNYTLLEQSILHLICINSFHIFEKLSIIAYHLDLPSRFRDIHPIISLIHLEPFIPDTFGWPLSTESDHILNGYQYWKVEQIIENWIQDHTHQLKVWWTHSEETWEEWNVLL